jgi:hypothetical protein
LGVINVDPDDGTGIAVPRSQHGLSEAAGEQDRESRLLFEVVAGFDVSCCLNNMGCRCYLVKSRSPAWGQPTDPHDPPGRNHLAVAGTVILACSSGEEIVIEALLGYSADLELRGFKYCSVYFPVCDLSCREVAS